MFALPGCIFINSCIAINIVHFVAGQLFKIEKYISAQPDAIEKLSNSDLDTRKF